MLQLHDVHIRYGAVEAVRGIDLEVRAGEVVALLGPNGAGKTSTLRAASGLEQYSGSIAFDGVECRRLGPERLASAGLIQVPEGRRLFSTLTVHENLQVGLHARGSRQAWTCDKIYDLFPILGPLRRRQAWQLSGGEQQMVALGRALVAGPRLLLLDEPSLGLAPKVTAAVFDVLKVVAQQTPILLVEQNTAMALRVCTRGVVLLHGQVVLEGLADELSNRGALVASYLGQSAS